MKIFAKTTAIYLLLNLVIFSLACRHRTESAPKEQDSARIVPIAVSPTPEPSVSPQIPNLQAELLDERGKKTESPIGAFDFKNFTFPLPRGWQNDEGEITLENGHAPMSEEEKKIGASFVTIKFGDATGDLLDEAFVIIKLETGGAAIPQIVYVFEWKNDKPELIWYFRTGDRADGGLKDIRAENGGVIVELFGQDRYILGELDTSKITGDEEQLCCPTHYTQSRYKWNGNVFRLEGRRLTYSVSDKNAPPVENMGEVVEKIAKQNGGKK